jgi:hypothetical protein
MCVTNNPKNSKHFFTLFAKYERRLPTFDIVRFKITRTDFAILLSMNSMGRR